MCSKNFYETNGNFWNLIKTFSWLGHENFLTTKYSVRNVVVKKITTVFFLIQNFVIKKFTKRVVECMKKGFRKKWSNFWTTSIFHLCVFYILFYPCIFAAAWATNNPQEQILILFCFNGKVYFQKEIILHTFNNTFCKIFVSKICNKKDSN